MNSKLSARVCFGLLGVFAAGLAAADDATEYTTLGKWIRNVRGIDTTTFHFLNTEGDLLMAPGYVFGQAAFTAQSDNSINGYRYNDGAYGDKIQYMGDSAQMDGQQGVPGMTVNFDASSDITAAAFNVGTFFQASPVYVSVNGAALSPLLISSLFPTAFVGITDKSGPITSISFTATNATGELDLVNGYATGSIAAVPELDFAPAGSAITLLLGTLAVIKGRSRSMPIAASIKRA